MRYGRYGYSQLFLRLGLGITFVWIGVDMFRNPTTWVGYLPQYIPFDLTREMALQGAAIFDLTLGLFLLAGNFPRITATLAAIHIAGILVVHRVDAVLIRDVGLLGAALALVVWPYHKHGKKHWWHFGSRGKGEN